MKLSDEQMEIIEKADKITGCYSSTIEETHWLNEEEAYSLIESFVENPLNDRINELNKKLNAQDKIINTQALEIARLKENNELEIQDENMKLARRIIRAIDYIKENFDKTGICVSGSDLPYSYIEELLAILGDKENEK